MLYPYQLSNSPFPTVLNSTQTFVIFHNIINTSNDSCFNDARKIEHEVIVAKHLLELMLQKHVPENANNTVSRPVLPTKDSGTAFCRFLAWRIVQGQ